MTPDTKSIHDPTATTPAIPRPLGDRVIVKRLDGPDKTPGGIVLPDTAKEKPNWGRVIAVGPGTVTAHGQMIPPAARVDTTTGPEQMTTHPTGHPGAATFVAGVRVGDEVLFTKYAALEVEVGEETYLILSGADILAVLEE
jgi:chaperonin GroES